MTEDVTEGGGLDIEARQDELLRQLDELNGQVERALAALLGDRPAVQAVATMVPGTMRKFNQAA